MPTVSLKNINKIYDNNVQAVFDFNLDIKDGEFIVLVGPSGCGKSTTLRMIAGLEEITSGELDIDGVISNDLAPKDRDIAMVFQNYALYPHMSVYDNMAFGLKNRKIPKDEIDKRVKEAAEILDITEYLDRKPKALSGGQCQRVALGRAIVRQAKTFLMDEPLSNLDAKLRVQMRAEIVKLHKRIKTITIYVTHDQTEAMTMADRIVVMSKGYIQQIGTPKEIYNHPVNLFVAGFIGSPSMNFIPATYSKKGLMVGEHKIDISKEKEKKFPEFFKRVESKFAEKLAKFDEKFVERNETLQQIELLEKSENVDKAKLNKLHEYIAYLENFSFERKELVNKLNYFKELDINNNDKLIVGIRPEDVKISLEKKDNYIPAVAGVVELLGHEQIVHFTFNDKDILAKVSSKVEIEMGQKIFVNFDDEDIHLFDSISEDALF